MRVLLRLVVALGDRDDHNPAGLAEIEQGRTDQVADVLDDDDTSVGLKLVQGPVDHRRVEVAAGTRVHLDAACARRPDAFSIDRRLLVAFDDAERRTRLPDRSFQQRGLTGSRRTHDIDRGEAPVGKPLPVVSR